MGGKISLSAIVLVVNGRYGKVARAVNVDLSRFCVFSDPSGVVVSTK